MTPLPKPIMFRTLVLSMLLAIAWATLGAASIARAATHSRGGSATANGAKVVKRPVTFQVRNVNRSILPCPSDGAQYELKGDLVGPASEVGPGASGGRRSVTLYLHGFSLGGPFWSFSAVPSYDYAAALARAGHVSVVLDRFGYGTSGQPDGNQTCLGANADVAHQVIGELRSGDYVVEGGGPPRFDRVALAGHSVGALIANLEVYSFGDVDVLVDMSYSTQVTQRAFQQFYRSREVCDAGGEPLNPGGPAGYVYFGQSAADFGGNAFHSAEPAVRAGATRLRGRDPCGDGGSLIGALVQDLKSVSKVQVPVLLVCGRQDAMTPTYACVTMKRRFVGTRDVSLYFVANAGSALPLERTAPIFRRRVSAWLNGHGF